MLFRAVGQRCAVRLDTLHLPITCVEAIDLLLTKGCTRIEGDVVSAARACVGTSQYRRSAHPSLAPETVDCSSFTKWVYGTRGIWLPRRTAQQRELGESVDLANVAPGDIIFTTGWKNWYRTNPDEGVGHVGIVTELRTVVHAANKRSGVVETPIDRFLERCTFRGVRRYITHPADTITFAVPDNLVVETEDDFFWIIVASLPEDLI